MKSYSPPPDGGLNDRAQHFLKVLIERYIRDGEPVGSKLLAQDAETDLSAATVRNVMADLEEMGLIAAPHTSAGRVPTVDGYRLFVDSLMKIRLPNDREVEELNRQLGQVQGASELVESASRALSMVTQMAGIVMVPRRSQVLFRQMEFLRLSGNRVLVILVTEEGEVLNKIVHTKRTYSRAELEQAANYVNQAFSNLSLKEAREKLLLELQQAKAEMNKIMERAVEMAKLVLEPSNSEDDCVIAGQTNLMSFDELSDMEQLKTLFKSFTEKHQILHLLDGCLRAEGVQIFIGEESGYQPLDQCSVVVSNYEVDNEAVGVLGVIGPKRMAYGRVVPIVDVTAKLLGAALKQL